MEGHRENTGRQQSSFSLRGGNCQEWFGELLPATPIRRRTPNELAPGSDTPHDITSPCLPRSWATNQGTAWHRPPSQILEANRFPEMSPQISQVTEMKHSGPLWALMGSAIWQDQPEQREPVPGETFFPGCSICCRTPKAGDRTPGP